MEEIMKGMRRIKGGIATALLVAAALLPVACASGGRQDTGQSDSSYSGRHVSNLTERNFEREKATASNPG